MSEPEFTPGPWKWRGGYSDHGSRFVSLVGPNGDSVIDGEFGGISDNDADLLAASLDLFNALEQIVNRYVDMVNSGECGFWDPEEEAFVVAARAAIAKARGEDQE